MLMLVLVEFLSTIELSRSISPHLQWTYLGSSPCIQNVAHSRTEQEHNSVSSLHSYTLLCWLQNCSNLNFSAAIHHHFWQNLQVCSLPLGLIHKAKLCNLWEWDSFQNADTYTPREGRKSFTLASNTHASLCLWQGVLF